MTSAELVARFRANAGNAAADTHAVDDGEGLRRILFAILPQGALVYCPEITQKEKAAAAAFPSRAPEYAAASVTVEEVHGAIAETGSVVSASSGGRPLQASLLPAHHVAIVSRERIFETLDDFFASVAEDPPTNITLITGPSRTADIELTLAIGVHGPGKLDVIVY